LVPYGDAAAFAAAALDLLRDPGLRDRYAEEARAWARRFTWEEAAIQTERVLAQALSLPAPGPGSGLVGPRRAP
jgi:glycosyltransferase involved in cell wall biosynthesis